MKAYLRTFGVLILCIVVLIWAVIIMASPRQLPSHAISSVSLPDGTYDGWLLISGHAFDCNPTHQVDIMTRCETQIAGQTLALAVGDGSSTLVSRYCSATYAGQPVDCIATTHTFNLASPLPHVRIPVNLNLTEAQLRQLRWQNWAVNIPEWAWVSIAITTAGLVAVAVLLWAWPLSQKRLALAFSAAGFLLAWVFVFGLLQLWYVD